MRNPFRRTVIALALPLVFLGGCASSPEKDFHGVVEMRPPLEWSADPEATGRVAAGWIDDFGDPRLGALVKQALGANNSFAAATARLEAARQLARVNGATVWPTIDASLNGSRRQSKVELESGGESRITSDRFSAAVAVSWEVDFLGKVHDRSLAASADWGQSLAGYEAARLSLAANVARSWFDLLEAEAQRQLAAETVASFESNLEVIEQQYASGIGTALEVRLLRANVASARASLAGRERTRDVAARTLEVLVGDYPSNTLEASATLPELTAVPPPGLPSELLLRRPDLRSAEFAVEAANLRASEARKALFPSIRLTAASGGRESDELSNLLDGGSAFWSLAGGLTAPLFHGGALRAASRRSRALAEAAVADYRQTVLVAFQEVESALAAEALLRAQETALAIGAEESSAAEALAWERYQRGLVDIVTVLESQRRAFTFRQSFLTARNQRLRNRIALHLALGGSFTASPLPTP